MDERIHEADESRDVIRRDEAGEYEMLFEAKRAGGVFKTGPPLAVADEEEFHFRTTFHQPRRHGEEIVVTFQLEQPRDFANDDVVGRETQSGAKLRIVLGGEKRREIEAAEN